MTGTTRRTLVRNTLLALGTGALTLAVLLPLWVHPRLAQLPHDADAVQLQETDDATVLVPDLSAPAGARVLEHVPFSVQTAIGPGPSHTPDDSVHWQLATRVDGAGRLIQARVETVSLNRRTALPNSCCGDHLLTDPALPMEPLTHRGYVTFPFDTKKRDYPVWDIQLKRARTARYVGTDSRDGMRVYRFEARTDWTEVENRELPGSLFGLPDPSVDAVGEYADVRTYFVEPVTGTALDVSEQLDQRYRYGDRTVTAVSAALESPSLPADRLDQIRQGVRMLPWVEGRATLVLVPLALLAFLAAFLVGRRRSS